MLTKQPASQQVPTLFDVGRPLWACHHRDKGSMMMDDIAKAEASMVYTIYQKNGYCLPSTLYLCMIAWCISAPISARVLSLLHSTDQSAHIGMQYEALPGSLPPWYMTYVSALAIRLLQTEPNSVTADRGARVGWLLSRMAAYAGVLIILAGWCFRIADEVVNVHIP